MKDVCNIQIVSTHGDTLPSTHDRAISLMQWVGNYLFPPKCYLSSAHLPNLIYLLPVLSSTSSAVLPDDDVPNHQLIKTNSNITLQAQTMLHTQHVINEKDMFQWTCPCRHGARTVWAVTLELHDQRQDMITHWTSYENSVMIPSGAVFIHHLNTNLQSPGHVYLIHSMFIPEVFSHFHVFSKKM